MSQYSFVEQSVFHILSRIATIKAVKAGLTVRVEAKHVRDDYRVFNCVWYGTEQQFRAFGVLTPSMKAPVSARKTLRYFGQLVGEIQKCGADCFSYTIIDVQDNCSPTVMAQFAREATRDANYLRFRTKLLAQQKI